MGEIADMMLEGILCEGCGVYIGDGDGFPGLCSGCAAERRSDGREIRNTGLGYYQDVTPTTRGAKRNRAKINCPECGRRVKKAGLKDHIRVKHQGERK